MYTIIMCVNACEVYCINTYKCIHGHVACYFELREGVGRIFECDMQASIEDRTTVGLVS